MKLYATILIGLCVLALVKGKTNILPFYKH